MLLAIDPGLRKCGVAQFEFGKLQAARLAVTSASAAVHGPDLWCYMVSDLGTGIGCSEVAVEFPKVYQGGKQKGDPADLLEIAAVVGAIARKFEAQKVTRYFPHQWKGQMDKPTCHARIRERLSGEELQVVTTNDHNVWDAIGIGLHHLGRFDRKRVFAR